jgi:hypothetical protein
MKRSNWCRIVTLSLSVLMITAMLVPDAEAGFFRRHRRHHGYGNGCHGYRGGGCNGYAAPSCGAPVYSGCEQYAAPSCAPAYAAPSCGAPVYAPSCGAPGYSGQGTEGSAGMGSEVPPPPDSATMDQGGVNPSTGANTNNQNPSSQNFNTENPDTQNLNPSQSPNTQNFNPQGPGTPSANTQASPPSQPTATQ